MFAIAVQRLIAGEQKKKSAEECTQDLLEAFLSEPEEVDEARNSRLAREVASEACAISPFSSGTFGKLYRVRGMAMKLVQAPRREDIIAEYDLAKAAGEVGPDVYAVEAVKLPGPEGAIGVILMELMDGDLLGLLGTEPAAAMKAVEESMPGLIDGLAQRGLTCIDMKPANVLYKRVPGGGIELKLTDWDRFFCARKDDPPLQRLIMATLISSSVQDILERRRVTSYTCGTIPGCALQSYITEQIRELADLGYSTAAEIVEAMESFDPVGDSFFDDSMDSAFGFMAHWYNRKPAFKGATNRETSIRFLKLFMERLGGEPPKKKLRRSARLRARSQV